jgi:hypothetical protein
MIKTYRELIRLETFEERFEYLKLGSKVGQETFGFDRYLNQVLYRSPDWKRTRDFVIIRDGGCDLGIEGREILTKPIVHHINPITFEDIENREEILFNTDNLITTYLRTHNAIHFGDASLLIRLPKERAKGDTTLWTAY